MEKSIILKIQSALDKGTNISEHEVRSLMILVRKRLELMSEEDSLVYLTLNLFCNWAAHIEITGSITGLRVLAKVNDILVRYKDSNDLNKFQIEISQAVGLDTLYSEFIYFLQNIGIPHNLSNPQVGTIFKAHIIEIIRDVPLAFPEVRQLKNSAKKIYDSITQNPIKVGAGVISLNLSKIQNVPTFGNTLFLVITTEDSTKLVIPFLI